MLEQIKITWDGNCLYKTFLFLIIMKTKILKNIYKEAIKSKNDIKEFFIEDAKDGVIINIRIENYIEKIQEDAFYRGIIEIGLVTINQNINISVYKSDNEEGNFHSHFTNVWKIIKIIYIRFHNIDRLNYLITLMKMFL